MKKKFLQVEIPFTPEESVKLKKYKNFRIYLWDRYNEVIISQVVVQSKTIANARRIASLYKKRYSEKFKKERGVGYFPSGLRTETYQL